MLLIYTCGPSGIAFVAAGRPSWFKSTLDFAAATFETRFRALAHFLAQRTLSMVGIDGLRIVVRRGNAT